MNNSPFRAAGNDAATKSRDTVNSADRQTSQERRPVSSEHGAAVQHSADYLRDLLIRGIRSAELPSS